MLGRYEAARERMRIMLPGDIAMKWQAQYLAVQCQVHLIDQAPTVNDRNATVNACNSTIAELIRTVTITNLIPSLHALRDLVLSKSAKSRPNEAKGPQPQTQAKPQPSSAGRRSDEDRRRSRRSPARPGRRRRASSSSRSRSRSSSDLALTPVHRQDRGQLLAETDDRDHVRQDRTEWEMDRGNRQQSRQR